jgi:hypothetical protein
MLLGDFLRLLRRHWVIALVGILIAGAGAAGAESQIAPTYLAKATVLLVPSTRVPGIEKPVNPFQNYGSYTAIASSVLGIQTQGSQSVTDILHAGGTAQFTVGPNPNATGAAIDVTATAADGTQALQTVNLVIAQMGRLLTNIQTQVGAPAGTFLSIQIITQDPAASAQHKSAVRGAIAVAVAALVLTGLALGLAENRSRRRARRLAAKTPNSRSDAASPSSDKSGGEDPSRGDSVEPESVEKLSHDVTAGAPSR